MNEKQKKRSTGDSESERLKRPRPVKAFLDRLAARNLAHRTTTLSNGATIVRPFSWSLTNSLIILVIFLFFWDMIVGAYFDKYDFMIFVRRIPNFLNILQKMWTEFDWSYFDFVVDPMVDTIQMALLGTAIGAVFSLPVAFLASANIVKSKIVSGVVKTILSFVRTFPTLVYAAILAFIFGYGTLIGVLATAIFTFGILTKMLFEVIETLDLSSFVAIEATGASKGKAFITSVIPQIMGSFLSFTLYSIEINIRSSAILGYVGAGGVGIMLDENMNWRRYGNIGVILVVLFVSVLIIENISRYLRKKLS